MWRWADKHDTVDLPDDDWIIAGAVDIPANEWRKLRVRLVDHPFAPLRKDEAAGVVYSPRRRKEYELARARHEQARVNGMRGGRPKSSPKPSDNRPVIAGLPRGTPEVSDGQAQPSRINHQGSEIAQRPLTDVVDQDSVSATHTQAVQVAEMRGWLPPLSVRWIMGRSCCLTGTIATACKGPVRRWGPPVSTTLGIISLSSGRPDTTGGFRIGGRVPAPNARHLRPGSIDQGRRRRGKAQTNSRSKPPGGRQVSC